MVDAARAKGWRAVTLFGPPDFIAEATRQFEAAGIPVVERGEPPAVAATSAEESEDAETTFRRRLAATEKKLAKSQAPLAPFPWLTRAEQAEAKADEAWRATRGPCEDARKKRDAAERDLKAAGLFARTEAKRVLAEADSEVEKADAKFAAAREAYEAAKSRADRERLLQAQREKRHAEEMAGAERRAQSVRDFTAACLATIEANRKLATADIEAIEEETRKRLAGEAERNEADRDDLPSTAYSGPS